MGRRKSALPEEAVYTEAQEAEFYSIGLLLRRLKRDPETGSEACEICGEALSTSVEGDVAIKCRTCGLKVVR